jgi:hypothetical protein
MFKRLHHQQIEQVLRLLNVELLVEAKCYFGGGTAIVLALNEYRESVDIDLLCSSLEGYRLLRNTISSDLGPLLTSPIKHIRDVRVERDKFSTFLEVEGQPIKIEFLYEGNTIVDGDIDPLLGIPILSRVDMYTQKLLANADRGLDKVHMSRDIIDLAMMIDKWGSIPKQAWEKAYAAYGDYLIRGFHNGIKTAQDPRYLASCLHRMSMDAGLLDGIPLILDRAATKVPLAQDDQKEWEKRLEQLPMLECLSGARNVFWGKWTEALTQSNDELNWSDVERKTMTECLGQRALSPKSVIDVLCKYSPAAVTAARQASIEDAVERLASGILTQDDDLAPRPDIDGD